MGGVGSEVRVRKGRGKGRNEGRGDWKKGGWNETKMGWEGEGKGDYRREGSDGSEGSEGSKERNAILAVGKQLR